MFSRLMFLREVQPGTPAHSVAVALRCPGGLDLPSLGAAAGSVAARRASARAVVLPTGGVAETIGGAARAWLREHDASGLDDSQLTAWLEYAAHEPFDTGRGPLLRVHLYRTTASGTVVLVVAHHAITDFWSMTTLVRDLEASYCALTASRYEPLPELTDFVRHYCWVSGSRVSAHAAPNPDSDFLRRLG